MYIVIINPNAGSGKGKQLFEQLKEDELFKKKNCRTFLTEYDGHAERVAEQVAAIHHDVIKCVIVIGGDGTLYEVLNGLRKHSNITIGFIPVGTGNDFARGIGQSDKGVDLFRKLITSSDKKMIYTGKFSKRQSSHRRTRLFMNCIGFGLDGYVASYANRPSFRRWIKRFRVRPFTYPIALVVSLMNYKPIEMDMEIDGVKKSIKESMMVTISNSPYYGGGMNIAPGADITKPYFHVLIVGPISKWKLLFLFVTVFFGKHTIFKEVTQIKAKSVKISSPHPLVYQVDGHVGSCSECTIQTGEDQRAILIG
ncbi:diacylglycerol/lipid kinase family protein [Halobacillus yeomjeoni]|uniref:Diacylglycerol kinase family lipid kinase n=1 Tax=Halobacillus yeomjeoni TaxID=311194 RepID=A0A931HV15_9BACI|nr:diacylglycerol kinase family protein [Halobacillus yeomjeoni]MBH0230197.1 diacylglycerol kinase family lipid kinase [Halobacillus yeomjeoni]